MKVLKESIPWTSTFTNTLRENWPPRYCANNRNAGAPFPLLLNHCPGVKVSRSTEETI